MMGSGIRISTENVEFPYSAFCWWDKGKATCLTNKSLVYPSYVEYNAQSIYYR